MTNLFAFVSTDPQALRYGSESIGAENDTWLGYLAAHSGIVVACWGHWPEVLERAETVKGLIPNLYCLGTTKQGQPRHPLYLPKETKLEKYIPLCR